jgi:hypothetical protein
VDVELRAHYSAVPEPISNTADPIGRSRGHDDADAANLSPWANDKTLAFVFGASFAIILLVIAFFDRRPTEMAVLIYRVVLALVAAGIGAVIPGVIDVTIAPVIRAGGAIALFVVVYWFNPPNLVVGDKTRGEDKLPSKGVPPSTNLRKLDELRFNFPLSPLSQGWEFKGDQAGDNSFPEFSAPSGCDGGICINTLPSRYIERILEPFQKVCNRLRFRAKFANGAYAYARVRVVSKNDQKASKLVWIAYHTGNKPAERYMSDEWVIYGKPSADGWTAFDSSLIDELAKSAFGRDEGYEFRELLLIRLRGSLSISPIELWEADSWPAS